MSKSGVLARAIAVAGAFVVTVGLAGPVATAAAVPAAGPDRAAADHAYLSWVGLKDPRSIVRVGAMQAWISSAPDAAAADFFASGFTFAQSYSEKSWNRETDFARRVVATQTAQFAPEVNAAAQRAVNGTTADRKQFAATGFATAREADRLLRATSGQLAAALTPGDRDYVVQLATNAPGAQVRAAAALATQPDAGDGALVEFFAYDWSSAGKADLEASRRAAVDAETGRRGQIDTLVDAAQAADKAVVDAAPENVPQAKADAAKAWHAVADQTGPSLALWSDVQVAAAQQDSAWWDVVTHSRDNGGLNWHGIVDRAGDYQNQWKGDTTFAAAQSAYWNALLLQANDGIQRSS